MEKWWNGERNNKRRKDGERSAKEMMREEKMMKEAWKKQ